MRHGYLHAGGRVWPVDWRLADGRHGRALSVHAGLLLLFLGVLSGNSSFSGSAVDRLQRRDSLWNRVRMDVYLPEHSHRSEEHTSELQSPDHLVCRLLLEKKKKKDNTSYSILYI